MRERNKIFVSWKEVAAYVICKTGEECEVVNSEFTPWRNVCKFNRTEEVEKLIREYYNAKDNGEPLMVDIIKYNKVRDEIYRRIV